MGIMFSGISSGMDTGAIVESFVYAEKASIRQMQTQKSDYNKQLSGIRDLNSKMQSLQTSMQEMSEVGDFLNYSASLSNEDAAEATANGDATPGTYDIEVLQIAKTERDYSKTFADKDVAGVTGDGTFSITVGTNDVVDVAIAATDTLEDVVNKINASDAEVNASILYTGTEYRIQITGTESGAENGITFGETGTLDMQLTEYSAAQDAKVKVDGYTISSNTNTFDESIAGITLNVKETTIGETFQLEIKPDTEKIEEKIDGFISSYNEIISLVKNDKTSNSTLRSLQMQFSMTISSEIGDVGGTFSALSQIGISTSSDGKLSLDSDDLEEALAKDTRGVAKLFAGSDDDTVDGLGTILDDFIEKYVSTADGVLAAQESGIKRMISSIEGSILQEEDRITSYEEGLTAKFTAMEIQMNELNSQMSYMGSMMM